MTQALAGVSLAEMVLPPIDFMALFPVADAAPDVNERTK
jgi:hypothetical protein